MSSRFAVFSVAAMLMVAAILPDAPVTAQSGMKTVWNGVYTDAQAARGEAAYEANCAPCHGSNLDGVAYLKGNDFMERWRELNVRSLYDFINKSMPRQRRGSTNRPGSLSEVTYVDIMAHIFRANGFPSGSEELGTAAMKNIQIEFQDGPRPLPNGALVRVVGCLNKRGADWVLTRANDPVRTATPESTTAEELAQSGAQPAGVQLYGLANIGYLGPDFDITAHANHKMQAKGILVKPPGNFRINLTSLEMLVETCP
jgi:hypothetical protein